MTKAIFYIMMATGLLNLAGCSLNSDSTKTCYSEKNSDSGKVLTSLLNKPHFKGGNDSLVNFLLANVDFEEVVSDLPENAAVYYDTARIKFIVSKQGSLSDLSITRATKKKFADEIAKVIKKSSCDWVAGSTEAPANGWFQFDLYFSAQKSGKELKTSMTFNEYVATN